MVSKKSNLEELIDSLDDPNKNKGIMQRIYLQLVPSRKRQTQLTGNYRTFIEEAYESDRKEEAVKLVKKVISVLERQDLKFHARRLRLHYGIEVNLNQLIAKSDVEYIDNPNSINDIYNQLVPNEKTGKRKDGVYKDFVDTRKNYLGLVDHIATRLEQSGSDNLAKKLRAHYSISDSWMESGK